MLSRRQFLKAVAALSLGSTGFAGYAVAEPWRLNVTRHRLSPSRWPADLKLKLAVLTDIHACDPWMPADRIRQIVARTNALAPDAVLLLGDYVVGRRLGLFSRNVPHDEWASALGGLKAPCGVHAVLGNHDWWEDQEIQRSRSGPVASRIALERAGIPVYENDAVRLTKGGKPFWIAGLGDQWAFWPPPERYEAFVRNGKVDYDGVHDVAGTLAKITDDAPAILMAHEPDIFAGLTDRFAVTVSGHTHGGQIRFGDFAPFVPSRYGRRYVYGHIVENERHLVVSGGLGCSGLPMRFGAPPEIVLIEIGANAAQAAA